MSGAMVSRLVRYWLEMVPGTRTGPRNLRVPATRDRQVAIVGGLERRAQRAQRIDQVLVRTLLHGDVPVDDGESGRSAANASISRVVTALWPTSSATLPPANCRRGP